MTGKTHLAAGITTALILGVSAPQTILIGFGALLPDIDHGGSKLGHMVKPLSMLLTHRGFTHSLIFAAICFILNPFIGIGVLTHLFLDFLNPKGEQLFWPLKAKIKLPLFSKLMKTGKTVEMVFFLALILFSIFLVILSLFPQENQTIFDVWYSNFELLFNNMQIFCYNITHWFTQQ